MKSVLVLCEGNICRSPMAQVLLADALPGVDVRSAGLGALVGRPADEAAQRLVRELGLDLTDHRATQVTDDMCAQAELVLVMEASQRQRLEAYYPQVSGKVFRLGHFVDQDIPDPYRQGDAMFRLSLQLIRQGVDDWRTRIHKL
jgi:protein-tyrosine phosphatase